MFQVCKYLMLYACIKFPLEGAEKTQTPCFVLNSCTSTCTKEKTWFISFVQNYFKVRWSSL